MREQLVVGRSLAAPGWRPKLGLLLLILALVSPLLVPLVLASDLSRDARAALSGLLLFGVPMALMVVVIGLIGQPAYRFIMNRIAGRPAFPPPIGATRYRIGLVMLCIGVLVSWLEPLVSPQVPQLEARRVLVGALADGLVLASLFVVGGEFWDKVHALFLYDARVLVDRSMAGVYQAVRVGWRFYAGVAVIACSFGAWGLVPIASAAGWSTAQIASLSGAIFIVAKVGLIAAVAIMGKDGFNYLKLVVSRFLRQFGPPQQVSRRRYGLGLGLFMVPVAMTWIAPYVTGLLQAGSVFGFLQSLWLEAMLLVGVFLLGGEFWDKVRALFGYRAQVEFAKVPP